MTNKLLIASLVVGVVGLSACSNQAKLDAQAAKAEQQRAQQIESTERAARDAQRRLDKQ
jgi:outer membrane murein-binding lipoprotein Lpp